VFLLLEALILVISAVQGFAAAQLSCLGPPYLIDEPPYLLATFHGGSSSSDVNQVYEYTRDGCLRSAAVLAGGPVLDELRGVAVLPSGDLLVANANKDSTKLVLYGGCTAASPSRAYRAVVAEQSTTLVHPYGLALHGTSVFVSNQDTYNVLRYTNTSGLGPWASTVFAQYSSTDGVRGLAVDGGGVLYVAVEQLGVLKYDVFTGAALGTVPCNDCIGLTYDNTTDAVYIGSSGDDAVYQYSVAAQTFVRTFRDASLTHPAGLSVHDGALFVNAQSDGAVLKFDVATGAFFGAIVNSVPDALEALVLSSC